MNDYTPSEEDLNAYVDGELSPHNRARVAQAVAADPKLADRIATLARLKSVVMGLSENQSMTLDDLGIATPRYSRPTTRIAASILAVVLIAGVVAAGFWNWRAAESDAWVATAKSRHLAWLTESGEQNTGDKLTSMLRVTMKRLEVPVHIPDMRSAKLTLSDAVYFQHDESEKYNAVQLRYTGRRGCRVSLTLSHGEAALDTSLSEVDDGHSRGFYWRNGEVNYALFATGMDTTRFTLLARNVYLATREKREPPEPKQRELRVATDTATPCRA